MSELWEDIFDQTINGWDSNWDGGGHSTDVVSEGKVRQYQNKSGEGGILEWSQNYLKENYSRKN